MIHEIVNFIDYLEENDKKNNTNIFSENLELKEGLYVFLEKEGDELIVKEENILKVDKDTEKNQIYEDFLNLSTNTEMINAMKSFNSGLKIYIAIGSPFGISISGLGLEKGINKRLDAADAYFKAAIKYVDEENEEHIEWMNSLKHFVNTKMFDYIEKTEQFQSLKKGDMFYFFMKEPKLIDYQEIQSRFLSEKLFNKDKFNIKTEEDEIFGISDSLSGFNDSKEFLKHKTAPIELNYRINGLNAQKLYQFFRLQQKNKILPNPFPLFVDEQELSEKAVKFYNKDKKAGHKEIVEELLKNRKPDLQNYYLIYFNNREKGSRIVDLDFVSVFRYKVDNVKLEEPFPIGGKLKSQPVSNIFEFQFNVLNKIFNNQLVTVTKAGGLWIKYFDDMDVDTKYGNATDVIVNLFYMYRKSIYDYIYKSKRQSITDKMFHDMMQKSILDDIKHDKKEDKGYRIKEKLNIWFSLYNYFVNSKNKENMILKIETHRQMIEEVARGERNVANDEEFAFAAGQVIYYLLSKSKSADKSYSRLEPFLQKSKYKEFRKALTNTFNAYKHENFSRKFSNPFANVTDYNLKSDLKELIPIMLAGFFSDCALFADKEETNDKQ